MGLSQEFVKKKKGKMLESEERSAYKLPRYQHPTGPKLAQGAGKELGALQDLFRYGLAAEEGESTDSK